MCGCREREAEKDGRGGTAELKEETGRWSGLPREERTCPICSVPGIDDVEHFILKCELCKEEQKDLFLLLTEIRGGGGAAGRHSFRRLHPYCIHTASGSERGRSSKNDREDVDQEVLVPDISSVIWH